MGDINVYLMVIHGDKWVIKTVLLYWDGTKNYVI